ncbi:unnamed protein product [Blepharisma stoltei]|uniref:Uncharacterized protein n=1 Tax=Blepharisma stoltei TaxID=1481888 RepID=A0AAU9I6X7_9CILI|nr:unnamed protein product [Blepharisma stoltei]
MSFGKTNLKPLDDSVAEQPSSPESPFPGGTIFQNNIFALETPRWLSKAHYFEGPEFAEEEIDVVNEEITNQENIFKSCMRTKTTYSETSSSNPISKQSFFSSRTKSVIVHKTDFSFANDVEELNSAKERFTALHCLLLSKLKIGRFAYKKWLSNWKRVTIFKNNRSEQGFSQYWKLQYVIEKFQGKIIENENKSDQLDKAKIKNALNRMKLRAEQIKKKEIRKRWLVRRIYIKLSKNLNTWYKETFHKIRIYGKVKSFKLEGLKKIRAILERHCPLEERFKLWKESMKDKDVYSYILEDEIIIPGIKKKLGIGKIEKGKKSIFRSLNIIKTKLNNKKQVSIKDTVDLSSLHKIKDNAMLLVYGINQFIENQKKLIEKSLDRELLALNESIEALNQEKVKSELQRSLLENQIDSLKLSNQKTEELILLLKSSSSKLTLDKLETKHQDYPISPTDSKRLFNSLPLPRKRNFLSFSSSHTLLSKTKTNSPKINSEPVRIKLKVSSSLSPLHLLFLSFLIGCFLCYLIS